MKIEAINITKKYGQKEALKDLSMVIEENKIYGLLGKNGAGKTTFMQLLAGHILSTSGKVLIDGQEPFNNRNVLKEMCLISESSNFKKRLKIKDVLKIASLFYPNWSQESADRLLKEFNLEKSMNTKGLSKGMESALGITIGLSSRAKITIFDEPYIGLDASARYKFYDLLLAEYEEKPRTFILSTHLIDEVSRLFEEVILLRDGQLLLQLQTDEMKEKSIIVSGKSEVVEAYSKGKNVIRETSMMGRKTAMLFGEVYNLTEARELGLEAERGNIQELMVHLSEHTGGEVHV
jgi:ABC-2 type transport system ATP-binding protein